MMVAEMRKDSAAGLVWTRQPEELNVGGEARKARNASTELNVGGEAPKARNASTVTFKPASSWLLSFTVAL